MGGERRRGRRIGAHFLHLNSRFAAIYNVFFTRLSNLLRSATFYAPQISDLWASGQAEVAAELRVTVAEALSGHPSSDATSMYIYMYIYIYIYICIRLPIFVQQTSTYLAVSLNSGGHFHHSIESPSRNHLNVSICKPAPTRPPAYSSCIAI